MWRADSETWTARDISSAPMSMLMTIAALPRPRMKGATITHAPPAISTAACVVWGITRLPIVERGYEHTCALCVTGITLIRTRPTAYEYLLRVTRQRIDTLLAER